jgi:peptidoglycan/xylan/chitin deacetylase (PgdA/CDA1 family)
VTLIHWNFFTKSVCSLSNNKRILLTFDDGPHPEYTPQILDILEIYQIKAIFFVIAKNAELYPELLKEISNRGHLIGNHSYSHAASFDVFSTKKMVFDIEKANDIIESICNIRPKYFRPPYGITNPRIHRLIKICGMISVGWTFRSYDTTKRTDKQIIKKMKRKMRGGEIILFHDSMERTPHLLESCLVWLTENYNLNNNEL